MKYIVDNTEYNVNIIKKNNKNLYIRVDKDCNINVSCNYLTTQRFIKKVLDENYKALQKMIAEVKNKAEKSHKFFYLGNSYDIIFGEDIKNTYVSENKIFSRNAKELDKWYKNEMVRIFDERYVYIFNRFKENVKSPIIKIRTMKTRWGVYNKKNHSITLNSKLIEFDIEKIDYVIIHELCHIIYFDHSKSFWQLVEKYFPEYKRVRKEMNN